MAKDLYEILGVSRQANEADIKTAYRKLARQLHPDVNPNDPSAEERFKEVSEAYDILSDPQKRARYDQFGSMDGAPPSDPFFGGQGFDLGDIFESFFGGGSGSSGRRQSNVRQGEDVRADLTVSLLDVLTGTEVGVSYRRNKLCSSCHGSGAEGGAQPEKCTTCAGAGQVSRVQQTFIGQVRTSTTCPTCQGAGVTIKNKCTRCKGRGLEVVSEQLTVKIPPGVEEGSTLRVGDKGGDGVNGGPPGDLYVVIHVAQDDRFVREGPHLRTAVEVSFPQVALGDTVTIDGVSEPIQIEIPAGTQPGTWIKMKGQGLPGLHGPTRGDLAVEIQVRVPKKLSEGQAQLLREFAELSGDNAPAGDSGILGGLFKKKK